MISHMTEGNTHSWRREIKLPILKPNKTPSEVGSYHPISLTSCVCKLLERMVNTRPVWFLEKKKYTFQHTSLASGKTNPPWMPSLN